MRCRCLASGDGRPDRKVKSRGSHGRRNGFWSLPCSSVLRVEKLLQRVKRPSEVEHYVPHRSQGVASERLLAPDSLLDELRARRRALPSREQRELLQQHHDGRYGLGRPLHRLVHAENACRERVLLVADRWAPRGGPLPGGGRDRHTGEQRVEDQHSPSERGRQLPLGWTKHVLQPGFAAIPQKFQGPDELSSVLLRQAPERWALIGVAP